MIIPRTCLIFLLLITACSSQTSPTQTTKIELVYWSANNQFEIDLAKKLVADWNHSHPDILVKHQAVPEGESSEEVILAAVVGKTAPDIYCNMWAGDVEFYVRAGKLLQLDQFADFDTVTQSRYRPDVLEQMRSRDGHFYQLLWKTNPIMLMFNKKLFAQAGYDHPPGTLTDFIHAGSLITQDLNGDGYPDRWLGITDIRARWRDQLFDFFPFYIAVSGGKTLLKQGQLAIDTTAAREVFSFFQEIFRRGYFPHEIPAGRRDRFIYGEVASRITGPWEIARMEKFKTTGFQYDFAPLPAAEISAIPVYTYADPKSVVVFSQTKFPQAAWRFASYLINRQGDYELLNMASQLPFRKDILQDSLFISFFDKNPMMLRFAQQADYLRGPDASPVLKEVFDAISQEFEACVFYQAKSPSLAVKNMMERIHLILE